MPERVGIVGVPPLAVIARLNREGAEIVDLDEPLSQASLDRSAALVPRQVRRSAPHRPGIGRHPAHSG